MLDHKNGSQERQGSHDANCKENQTPRTGTTDVHAATQAVGVGGSVNSSSIFTGAIDNSTIFTGPVHLRAETGTVQEYLYCLLPPRPSLLTGREADLVALKKRVGIGPGESGVAAHQNITAVRGWVGVGKTSLAAALAHDSEIQAAFPDGVLWASLGPAPSLLAELAVWGRALGSNDIMHARDVREASLQLAGLLRNKRILLFVDDVWEAAHAEPFKVGGSGSAMLITTRSETTAQNLVANPEGVYRLEVLSPEFALELLATLAPEVASEHALACRELVVELGQLPLALQVAGRLLQAESRLGFGVEELLETLRTGKKLLESQAPSDRADLVLGTTPTIAVLLEKSTERLEAEVRERFALLGVFAPEPWSFDLEALKAMWLTDDPRETVRELVRRGLLEPAAGDERFQLHALLALHARSMLRE